jgi:hypothetical protein
MKYIKKNHPLMLEEDYPYKGSKLIPKCNYDKSKGVGTVSSYKEIDEKNQKAMQKALM